jgi:hypothetical protein
MTEEKELIHTDDGDDGSVNKNEIDKVIFNNNENNECKGN